MTSEIFGRVLPFTIGVVGWRVDDPRAALPGALVVMIHIRHTDHY